MSKPNKNLSLAAKCVILLIALFAALPAFANVALLPQEQAIANYMISNPQQGRQQMILDPIVEAVARARAADMAHRGYFGHVNPDGHAANYLLRQAGYVLPAWWGTDPSANYVESIAAGYSDPTATWNAWMGDSGHKTHLLALNSFFASETHYGVAYYADPSSTYGYYWVVITAPPQPLEIMTPSGSQTVTTGTAALAGTTSTDSGIVTVQYNVANSTGTSAWTLASGTASWTGEVDLAPGKNVVRVQGLNGSGTLVQQASVTLTYVMPDPLVVTVSGSGSVTASFSGTTTRDVGTAYTIRATAAPGSIFTGWTGSVSSGSPLLTFTMQPGMQLQANFEPNPFAPVAGSYLGLVTAGAGTPDGFFHATLAANGVLSGRVTIGNAGYSFATAVNAQGEATITFPGATPVTLSLQADLSGSTQQIAGTVVDGSNSLTVSADRATANALKNPCAQAGRYTVILAPAANGDASQTPQGNGYATLVVSKSGAATISGRMGDGAPFTHSGTVTENGTLALWFVPSGEAAGSSVSGLLSFDSTNVSDVAGALAWTKAPNKVDPFYPAGFATVVPTVGSLYAAPKPGLNTLVAGSGDASAEVGDGNLSNPLDVSVAVGANGKGAMVTPGTPNMVFTVNPANGIVSGTFQTPGGATVRGFSGIVLQKQNAAFGYFRGSNEAGYFTLNPAS